MCTYSKYGELDPPNLTYLNKERQMNRVLKIFLAFLATLSLSLNVFAYQEVLTAQEQIQKNSEIKSELDDLYEELESLSNSRKAAGVIAITGVALSALGVKFGALKPVETSRMGANIAKTFQYLLRGGTAVGVVKTVGGGTYLYLTKDQIEDVKDEIAQLKRELNLANRGLSENQ